MKKFIDLFSKLGFSLNSGKETWNLLHIDQRRFQSRFLEHMGKESIDGVKEFLNEYLENETNLLVALLPTRNSGEQQQSAHSSNQDNLLRILVELEPLQSFIFDLLVEKTFSYGESTEPADRVALGITINVAIYCINQFSDDWNEVVPRARPKQEPKDYENSSTRSFSQYEPSTSNNGYRGSIGRGKRYF